MNRLDSVILKFILLFWDMEDVINCVLEFCLNVFEEIIEEFFIDGIEGSKLLKNMFILFIIELIGGVDDDSEDKMFVDFVWLNFFDGKIRLEFCRKNLFKLSEFDDSWFIVFDSKCLVKFVL